MRRTTVYKVGVVIGLAAAAWGGFMEWGAPGSMTGSLSTLPAPVRIGLGATLFGVGTLCGLAVASFLLWVYFLPSVIAHRRSHPQKTPILLINVLLSFTVLGWVVALVWANSALPEPPTSVAPTTPSPAGFCPHCGTARAPGAFCPGCGAKLG